MWVPCKYKYCCENTRTSLETEAENPSDNHISVKCGGKKCKDKASGIGASFSMCPLHLRTCSLFSHINRTKPLVEGSARTRRHCPPPDSYSKNGVIWYA